MPHVIKSLLGLGLNYCIQTPKPNNKLDETLNRFQNDVRRISFFVHNPQPEEENGNGTTYISELYIKSDWAPPSSVDPDIEDCISNFRKEMSHHQSRYLQPNIRDLLQVYNGCKTLPMFIKICNDLHTIPVIPVL